MIPSSLLLYLYSRLFSLVLIFKRKAEEGTSEHHLHPRNDVVFLVLLLVSLVLHVCLSSFGVSSSSLIIMIIISGFLFFFSCPPLWSAFVGIQ